MRPPKFIPTCDSILTPNVASTLQWKRHRIRRVAWYAEDNFNVNPTSSLSCHVSCADFFRRRALFLPLTRRPCFLRRGDTPPRGCLLHGATLERLCDCVLACRVVSRGHVPLMRSCPCPSWPSCPGCRGVPGHGRRDVAVTSLGVAVARRGRGCGVRCLCVAVVWLRHADEC